MKTKKLSISGRIILLALISVSGLYFISCGGKRSAKDPDKIAVDSVPAAEMVYTEVDSMPVFHGGDTALLKFIATNTIYPEEAKKNNIQGRVVVGFTVEKDGSVSDVNILKGIEPSIDAEARRVVGKLPKFEKPGIKNGVQVRVKFMVPITFALR